MASLPQSSRTLIANGDVFKMACSFSASFTEHTGIVAQDPHRHRDDRRRAGFDRAHVDSRAGDTRRQRLLERADQPIGVFASTELQQQLRVIRGRTVPDAPRTRTAARPLRRTT